MKIFRGIEPTEQQVTNFKNNLKLLDQLLGNNKYAAGSDLTIADLSLLATLSVLIVNDYKDLTENAPNAKKYVDRLPKELPYYNEVNGGIGEAFKEFIKK